MRGLCFGSPALATTLLCAIEALLIERHSKAIESNQSRRPGSNRRPPVYKTGALPAELRRRGVRILSPQRLPSSCLARVLVLSRLGSSWRYRVEVVGLCCGV